MPSSTSLQPSATAATPAPKRFTFNWADAGDSDDDEQSSLTSDTRPVTPLTAAPTAATTVGQTKQQPQKKQSHTTAAGIGLLSASNSGVFGGGADSGAATRASSAVTSTSATPLPQGAALARKDAEGERSLGSSSSSVGARVNTSQTIPSHYHHAANYVSSALSHTAPAWTGAAAATATIPPRAATATRSTCSMNAPQSTMSTANPLRAVIVVEGDQQPHETNEATASTARGHHRSGAGRAASAGGKGRRRRNSGIGRSSASISPLLHPTAHVGPFGHGGGVGGLPTRDGKRQQSVAVPAAIPYTLKSVWSPAPMTRLEQLHCSTAAAARGSAALTSLGALSGAIIASTRCTPNGIGPAAAPAPTHAASAAAASVLAAMGPSAAAVASATIGGASSSTSSAPLSSSSPIPRAATAAICGDASASNATSSGGCSPQCPSVAAPSTEGGGSATAGGGASASSTTAAASIVPTPLLLASASSAPARSPSLPSNGGTENSKNSTPAEEQRWRAAAAAAVASHATEGKGATSSPSMTTFAAPAPLPPRRQQPSQQSSSAAGTPSSNATAAAAGSASFPSSVASLGVGVCPTAASASPQPMCPPMHHSTAVEELVATLRAAGGQMAYSDLQRVTQWRTRYVRRCTSLFRFLKLYRPLFLYERDTVTLLEEGCLVSELLKASWAVGSSSSSRAAALAAEAAANASSVASSSTATSSPSLSAGPPPDAVTGGKICLA